MLQAETWSDNSINSAISTIYARSYQSSQSRIQIGLRVQLAQGATSSLSSTNTTLHDTMGHYDFFWDEFEDGGNGGTVTDDARSDVKQAIRVWLRQPSPNEQLQGLLALFQPDDAFYYIAPK